ncbi:MAG: MFS transporter, partial [Candidatus Obscuribacterales bacterium]|nr:MFS transporter [Candidatus Obscuribacterales bacterium]
FLLFWTSKSVLLSVIGLFIVGLGISNFYPLTLALAISSSPQATSKATSRISIASGSSTLIAPLLLGLLAEKQGIFTAYGLIAALLVLCSLLISLPVWSTDSKTRKI